MSEKRPETGPMQFGDDWPGVFIRGDDANYYGFQLDMMLTDHENRDGDPIRMLNLRALARLLQSCDVRSEAQVQMAQLIGTSTAPSQPEEERRPTHGQPGRDTMTTDDLKRIAEACGIAIDEDGFYLGTTKDFAPHLDPAQAIECLDRVFGNRWRYDAMDQCVSVRRDGPGQQRMLWDSYSSGPTFPTAAMSAILEVLK